MKILAILAALFLSIGYGYAQTYEKFVEKSFDFLDKNDLVSAEESLRAAMRLEPGNPNNYALLMNLGTIQRRQGKLEDALLSYTAALSRHPNTSFFFLKSLFSPFASAIFSFPVPVLRS